MKSYDVTIQMKPLLLYLHMVLLFFKISQNEISEFVPNLPLAKFDCEWFKNCFWIPSEMHLLGVFFFFSTKKK